MKPIGTYSYNPNANKTVLYIGVINDLSRRLQEHCKDAMDEKLTFAGKYTCFNLIYFERFEFVEQAIGREKELKG